ncbi:MAG: SMC family ATPase [Streptosporangiaceae bacterium]
MRPHRLELTAFGAFAEKASLNFDELEGLFLLHGETGAGKTTLLDAIAFALYGRVPGERGKTRRLRSDHAAPEVRTEVILEATIGGRRLRITRSPEQERPKKRGDGFTKEPAAVLLQELRGGGWEMTSTRAGEADGEIADLMGMSAEQFFQVVLLPQGQFAQFLQADAETRGKLLQKLFSTDRFRAVEDWLAQRRRDTDSEVKSGSEVVERLVAQVAQAAGAEVPADPEPQWAARLVETANAERDASHELVAGRPMRRQSELAASAPKVAAVRADIEAAARAAEIAPVLTEATRAAKAAEEAVGAEQAARSALPEDLIAIPGETPSAETLRAEAAGRRERLGTLEALRSVAKQADADDASATAARLRVGELADRLTGLKSELTTLRERREQATAARDNAQRAAAELVGATAEADKYRAAATDSAELVKANAERESLEAAHLTAREKAVGLQEIAHGLRVARFDSMRAELAASLTDDAECPVCGSFDHPSPCEMTGEWISREQEEAATAESEEAAVRRDEAGQRVARVQARIEELERRLTVAGFAAGEDAGALKKEAGRLAAQVAELKAAAASIDELQSRLERASTAIGDAEKNQAEATEQQLAATREGEDAARRAETARESLRAQLGDAEDLDAALSLARRGAEQLTAAADAADEASRRAAEQTRTRDIALQVASEAGFDFASARAAYRGQEWRAEQEDRVRRYDGEVQSVADQLASQDLDVTLEPPAPVAATAEAVTAAQVAHDQAVAARGRAQHTADQLAALSPRLTEALAALEPLVARATEVRQLADLAAGGGANTLRMTLSSFVLAARLEEVAEAASQRLLRMTAGRYSLVHTDERHGAKRAGLGLLACDSWTGIDRDTSTLSGGETFMASLALALGLADVVTAEAAGSPMEALFVDEGFGTLDEDTLDEVMNVLDGLREGGRVVGIVSHVAELRQRIPAQVQVRKGQHGSRVSVALG